MRRVLVLGGAGNFGARIVRDLSCDAGTEVLVASRRAAAADAPVPVRQVLLDITSTGFERDLAQIAPALVIHCAGPFQAQGYRVVRAALSAGANYVDLADGREFVAGFSAANDEIARFRSRTAICGASTLPALSS